MKRPLQIGLVLLGVLLAGGVVAPFIRIDHFREQIRLVLERNLHRRVEIYGAAHLNLFRGPGFSVEKVVIYDDPSAGPEPFANVPELQTTVSLSSLWTGSLQFGTVRFVEPSLNLVKPSQAPWNAIGLLAGATAPRGKRLPEIRISNGRINFKFGETKSAFYLTGTDVTVTPGRDAVEIRFACAPARTDRSQQGYGAFRGRGRIASGQIQFDVELERSPVEELVTLIRGQSLGLHGVIASRAKITGPLSHPAIRGRFELEDVHRWDLNPGRSGVYSAEYEGTFDVPTQRFQVTAQTPIKLQLAVENLFSRPEWLVQAALERLPAGNLVEFARHMGAPLPASMRTEGQVDGFVQYASTTGMTGQLAVANALFELDGGPQFRLDVASLEIAGDEIRLLPADLDDAAIEARYAPFRQHLEARLTARATRMSSRVFGISVPLLQRFRGGTWSGTLTYSSDDSEPGSWTAAISVKGTTTTLPGLAEPVLIEAAELNSDGARLQVHRLRALAGPVEFFGEYRYEPAETRPHAFNLTIPAADASDIEALLLPTLQRGSSNFLARTLRWRSAAPEWLRERRASGVLRIGTLSAGELRFRGVRSRVIWNGTTVQFPSVEARVEDGVMSARLTADLSRAVPQYLVTGSVRNTGWKNGQADLEGSVSSAGVGLDLLANLKAEGRFEARSVQFPSEILRTASGTFELNVARGGPQVRLPLVQATIGTERFTGEGITQADGRVVIDLASSTRTLRVSGPVGAPKLAIMELPSYGSGQRHSDGR